jgi:hypothetical protein
VHPVEEFRQRLGGLDRYPPGVVRVPDPIDGTAFFAAGPGLYCDEPPSIGGLPPFPFGKTLFVGHNLDAEGPYRRRLVNGVPHGDPVHPMRTWRGLYWLLNAAAIDRHDCFFTNAYVGLIEGDRPVGRFPGASDEVFSAWCEEFLRHQMATMRPSVIAAIGADARRFMSRLAPDFAGWKQGPSVAVLEVDLEGHTVAAVALAHPSMYPGSARNRQFGGEQGVAADAALLRAAQRASKDVEVPKGWPYDVTLGESGNPEVGPSLVEQARLDTADDANEVMPW